MFIKNENIIEKVIDESIYILNIDNELSYRLDDTSMIIWKNIDKKNTSDIIAEISNLYNIDSSQISSDIHEFIELLINSHLIKTID